MVIDPSSGFNKGVNNASSGPPKATKTGSGPSAAQPGATPKPSDSVTLSTKAHDMARLESAVKDSPDVRESEVAAAKAAIENGTYSINSRSIAEKMLAGDMDF